MWFCFPAFVECLSVALEDVAEKWKADSAAGPMWARSCARRARRRHLSEGPACSGVTGEWETFPRALGIPMKAKAGEGSQGPRATAGLPRPRGTVGKGFGPRIASQEAGERATHRMSTLGCLLLSEEANGQMLPIARNALRPCV